MNDKTMPAEGGDDAEPRFDVRARRPNELPLAELQRRLIEQARLSPEKAEALVTALQSVPTVVLGRAVSRARVEKARELERAGLEIEVTPVLSLAPKGAVASDGTTLCPACDTRSVLGPERQCPNCGVYVDKITPEFLLRRKIMEQERGRIAWQLSRQQQDEEVEDHATLEARLRDEIRTELETRHGLRSRVPWRESLLSWQTAGVVAAATGLSFAAGWWAPHWSAGDSVVSAIGGGRAQVTAAMPQDIDKLLARLDEFPPAAGQAGAAAGPDLDSWQQQVLAARGTGQGPALAGALSAMDDAPPGVGGASASVPRDVMPHLLSTFALSLAQAGQTARAAEALTALNAWRSSTDSELAALLRRSHLLVDAWSLQDRQGGAAERLNRLRTEAAALADPAERAATLGDLAIVLAGQPALPEALPLTLLRQSDEALQAVADPQRRALLVDAGRVDEAEVLFARARTEAATGHASRVRARAVALAALVPKASDPAVVAQVQALQARADRLLGEPAARGAAAWSSAVERVVGLPQRAATLRAVAAWQGDGLSDELRQSAARLTGRAEAASGLERAQALTELALLWAEAGQVEHYQLLRQRALQTPGVSGEAASRLRAELLAGGEIALAGAAHRQGDYAQADARWRKVAGLLM